MTRPSLTRRAALFGALAAAAPTPTLAADDPASTVRELLRRGQRGETLESALAAPDAAAFFTADLLARLTNANLAALPSPLARLGGPGDEATRRIFSRCARCAAAATRRASRRLCARAAAAAARGRPISPCGAKTAAGASTIFGSPATAPRCANAQGFSDLPRRSFGRIVLAG
ncbi:MAG: hypothetical protein HZY79_11040 [Rhodoblastus sp.]|nr:MAG: hypothetical protein HZY79_11040 [Rhodoblastus sp.]